MMNISAIDIGFFYVKGIINGKRVIMKSVVGNSKPLWFDDLEMGKNDKENIKSKVGTEEYFVSDLAIEQSDVVWHSLKEDRFSAEATEVLVRTAFALGFEGDNVTTHIVSGLPVSHYQPFKSKITELFVANGSKIHNYAVVKNNKLIKGSAKSDKIKIFTQPTGALLDRVLDDKGEVVDELAGKTVAVIDIGFGTTDVYVADALTPVQRLMFSTRTAMNHAYMLISNKIEENFGVALPLYSMEKVVRNGEFKKNGNIYDMEPVKQWAFKLTAQQLVSEIANKWKTMHEIDYILLTGGGGLALSKWILPHFSNIELVSDPQWAVVNGYYKWGVKYFG